MKEKFPLQNKTEQGPLEYEPPHFWNTPTSELPDMVRPTPSSDDPWGIPERLVSPQSRRSLSLPDTSQNRPIQEIDYRKLKNDLVRTPEDAMAIAKIKEIAAAEKVAENARRSKQPQPKKSLWTRIFGRSK